MRATVHERPRFAVAADAEGLQPEQSEEREAVVQLGDVEVGGPHLGPAPQLRRCASADAIFG